MILLQIGYQNIVEEAVTSSPNAYNPFNGGNYINYISTGKDGTPRDSAIETQLLMFIEKGKNLIVLILKLLIILFFLEIRMVSFAGGLEFRSDKFEDDRDPRLDGTTKYR